MTLYVAGILSANLAAREHPAVPAARRRPDADDRAQADLRDADQPARRAADLHGRVRVPVRVPDLGHAASTSSGSWAAGDRHDARPDSLRPRRRSTVSVDVGGVLVGSAHPVVVQSMTNTDTADADATAIQVARLAHAGSQLVRVTVNTEEAAAAVPEMVAQAPRRPRRRRAGHRRLPLQRPQAPGRVPGDGGGAREVPDQPRQRRREAPRRALRDDRPGRDRERQAGPDRGQLGLARPGSS